MTGSFTIIRNEINFIKAHLDAWLPHLDSMSFYDGNSTDGTLEILEQYAKDNPKIILVKNKDPEDLKDDYVRIFNECLWSCPCELAIFIHPDMLPVNGEILRKLPDDIICAKTRIESFAGEPKGDVYRISGRGAYWKNIYRLRNPKLGAHYFGAYGAAAEDIYFSEITGNSHKFSPNFEDYPYPIHDSGLKINHFSDVRPYDRRLERMTRCMLNQGYSEIDAMKAALIHPRVTLKSGTMVSRAGHTFDYDFKLVDSPILEGLIK